MNVPERFHPVEDIVYSINQYVQNGVPPGDFLQMVLENNLKESFRRADENNFKFMGLIVDYLYNFAPSLCWGSPEKVRAWLDFKQQQRNMEQLAKRETDPDNPEEDPDNRPEEF